MIRSFVYVGLAVFGVCFSGFADSAKVNNIEIARSAQVDLVFYTADDCDWCEKWKRHGKGDAIEWSKAAGFQYHEIAKRRIADAYTQAHFTTSAQFAWKSLDEEKRYKFMIPRWIVFADGRKVVEGAALGDWSRVRRFLNDVLEARDRKKD